MSKDKKKHPYNTLLPIHMQNALMAAADLGRIEMIDTTVRQLQEDAPHRFHNEDSVSQRKFYHEPRQLVPHSGFVMPYPGTNRS